MEDKYILTDNTITIDGHILYQIQALKNTIYCKKGDLGGFIENYSNLSQEGDCWVADNAKVYGISKIKNNSIISDNAIVIDSIIEGYTFIRNDAIIKGSSIRRSTILHNAEIIHSTIQTSTISAKVIFSYIFESYIKNNASIHQSNLYFCVICDNVKITNINSIIGTHIKGDAVINSISDFIIFKNHFSSGRYFIWTKSNNMWTVGCFNGTGEQLIEKAYSDSIEKGKYYEKYVKFVETL